VVLYMLYSHDRSDGYYMTIFCHNGVNFFNTKFFVTSSVDNIYIVVLGSLQCDLCQMHSYWILLCRPPLMSL
jgi:hypothetical protein